ncbi:MAG: DNA cytosine methyltransferase [Selenomonadaceae bacterium]|nr:DNA cytosine methyltransferase [Selenomonadaceae bacterium]
MTLGSLFDGIGCWQLAAQRAGIKTLWSSEIDNFCRDVTRYHFPETIQLGDINDIDCPPFSL